MTNSTLKIASISSPKCLTRTMLAEKRLITLEFTPIQDNEYFCPQPRFVFGERVVTREQGEYCQAKNFSIPSVYSMTVSAMELVESKAPSGELLAEPYWRYGFRCTRGTKELIWLEESTLLPVKESLC